MRAPLHRLGILAALSAAILATPADAQSAAGATQVWGLSELMTNLARVKAASGKFTERKTLHQLSQPLVTSGTLQYVAPDQVQKITMSPTRERFAISGNTLTIEGGPEDRTQQFSLTNYPEIGAFIEGIRAILAGDLPALNRFYDVQIEGGVGTWQLLLQPKEPTLRQYISRIRIIGSENRITVIETEERDGDHTEMSIADYINDER
jgi:hypothetical protein